MKLCNICCAASKSAITPSRKGLIVTRYSGVRPTMSLAAFPTPSISPVFLFMATMEGSSTTMPLPVAYTNVFAVPRSMPRLDENIPRNERHFIGFVCKVTGRPRTNGRLAIA
jgi:hypothetical protein